MQRSQLPPPKSSRPRFVAAVIWAVIVGSLMMGGAAVMGFPAQGPVMVGVLGGVGAAIYILFFAGSA